MPNIDESVIGEPLYEFLPEEEYFYTLIWEHDERKFIDMVNRKMKEGWTPDGDLIIHGKSYRVFYQRMRKL